MKQESFEAVSKRMQCCWNTLENLSGLKLTLHDHSGIIKVSIGDDLMPEVYLHRAACCRFPQKNRSSCIAHCSVTARKLAAEERKPFTMTCWRGIKELVMPLYIKNYHAATIFAGAFRDEDFDAAAFPRAYRKIYETLPVWDDSRREEIASILTSAGHAMLQLAENFRTSGEPKTGREKEIRDFFRYHYNENAGVNDLAAVLRLSESRTQHLLRKFFGRGFSYLLNAERITHVEEYLEQTELSLHEIAGLTGFRNEYYLSTVFKKYRGTTPGAFRRMCRSNDTQ